MYFSLVTCLVSPTSVVIWFTINSHNYRPSLGLNGEVNIHIDNVFVTEA